MYKYALQDTDGNFYASHGLDIVATVADAMRFDTEADAERVKLNLGIRFVCPFGVVKLAGESFGQHGAIRWRIAPCEQCGRFDGEFSDPTFDATRALPGTLPLTICEVCWKSNVVQSMRTSGH